MPNSSFFRNFSLFKTVGESGTKADWQEILQLKNVILTIIKKLASRKVEKGVVDRI
jgi:hypothetical protein